MKANFPQSLAAVLVHEGGYVNNPRDPGGATCKGVTQAVYDSWRSDQGFTLRSVKEIEQSEVEAIYRDLYWDKIRGDDLSAGVDYCIFDFAFNSGVNRAARFMQRAVGAVEDGKIGPKTLEAVKSTPPLFLIDAVCDLRMTFLRSLNSFQYFGRGWTRRVDEVRERAKAMAR